MWNHAQNCSPSGDEDTNEGDPNLHLKERIEKSLDLSQYLKYLDQLFGQATSESESSDSDEGERNLTFTEFRQPPVAIQHQDRSQFGHGHLLMGSSSGFESTNHVHSFTTLKPSDSFHIESNISSSSLSSIDSGTSSLNLSSENYLETTQSKTENSANGVSRQMDGRSSTIGTEDEKSNENSGDKEKKSQKKKRSGKSNNDTLPRRHKPSSGGKGNNGSKGGGGPGGHTSGNSSNDNSGSSSGSSSNQSIGGNSGSPGAKSRSGKQSLQKQTDSQPEMTTAMDIRSKYSSEKVDYNGSAHEDLQRVLGIHNSTTSDSLLMSEDLVDSFGAEDTFDSDGMSPFPLNSLLDSIPDEETSINDFISMSNALHSRNTSPSSSLSQFGTNLFSKIAECAAASATTSSSSELSSNPTITNSNNKLEVRKRKLENKKEQSGKLPKLTEKQKQSRIEVLNAKRRKIYIYISRKEVVKKQKTRAANFKEGIALNRKLAQMCARHVKKNAIQSQKCMKESVCKAKRLTQEMEMYWKSVEKTERDLQRKVEKEAEDSLKKDVNVLNKIRNEKLNCLITQIELFVNKLLNKKVIETSEVDLVFDAAQTTNMGDINSERINSTVDRAVKEHRSLVQLLDMSGIFVPENSLERSGIEPLLCKNFKGSLKNHQVFGINWIKNLYKMGLNGLLADESGLGKKVQVAGFLTHLAKAYGLLGPFLIISPSTSIISWQQELSKMYPKFKVVSYSGKPAERKIIRHGWEKNDMHNESAGFHVVITSYQVMAADLKYFSKIKWQYLIMDDSQNVITSSTKWMALLSFRCRNKLLLCDNPRLNSFRHLCSYLYFIMPSLSDSQKDLSEWLLLELESPATLNTCGNEDVDKSSTLSRLQVIIQHFLLRRELKDIKTEVEPCVDLQLSCPLTKRQRQIYTDLLEKVNLQRMLNCLEKCRPEEIRTRMKTVLNLSLQLRKTCNHPDLSGERFYSTSPLMSVPSITVPHSIYEIEPLLNHNLELVKRMFCIYNALDTYNSLFGKIHTREAFSTWSFIRLLNLSWKEVEELFLGGNAARLNHLVNFRSVLEGLQHDSLWNESRESCCLFNYPSELLYNVLIKSEVLSTLVFCSLSPMFGSWKKCKKLTTVNSIQHRTLQSSSYFWGIKNCKNVQAVENCSNFPTNSDPLTSSCAHLEYPDVFKCYSPVVFSNGYRPIISCKRFNRQILARENRVSVFELKNIIDENKYFNKTLCSSMETFLMSLKSAPNFLPELDPLVGDSGKMMILDKLLSVLKQQNHRVLIVSCIEESLAILEEWLKKRRWKYVRMVNGIAHDIKKDVFVYLMYTKLTVADSYNISVNTVVFFDQEWDTKFEDQKNKISSRLGYHNPVNYYRIICKGTIEERMIALANERNIVSLTLSKDVFGSKQVSSVPVLKSLLSILMCEFTQNRAWRNESALANYSPCPVESSVYVKDKLNPHKTSPYTIKHCVQNHYKDEVDLIHFENDNEVSDSASPSCSEDPDIYIDDEDNDGGVTGCPDEDNFSLSFDEGYMGMSPDSFEDVTIKSGFNNSLIHVSNVDYEEHSSPKKAKMGRGAGKRGRPPSRVRFHRLDICDGSDTIRRGPGRPRLKTGGPANQGTRGRKPGRPPLSKKAETISSGLSSLSAGQNVFGFYSSPDLELS